jgi:hypothetical protein
MQCHIIGHQNESLEDLIELCRRLDDELKLLQQSRRNAAYVPFSHTSKRTASLVVLASVRKATTPTPAPGRR